MIKIVRVGAPLTKGVHREYCGRGGKGEAGYLGNPFWMNDESKRGEVCDKFEVFFHKVIETKGDSSAFWGYPQEVQSKVGPMYKRMRELYKVALVQDVELACFCTPKRCHCSTIKNFLDSKLGERDAVQR